MTLPLGTPARICEREGCGKSYQPSYLGQRFCGHKCAFAVQGHKARAAAATPEARAKVADALRGRGAGKSYVKRFGRHEHRVVAEQMLGRPLQSGEIVHHEDEIKRNNDPSNLKVLASRAEHSRLHATGRKQPVRTQCHKGHELIPGNVYFHPKGRRICLTCRRLYDNAWKKARRGRIA